MGSVVFDAGDLAATTAEEVVRSVGIVLEEPQQLRRTRYDTFDARLRRRGLQLEARARDADAHALRVTGDNGPPAQLFLAMALPADAPLALARLPRGPLRSRLLAAAGERAVLPQITVTSQRRSGTVYADGIPQAVVHLDTELRVTAPRTVPRVHTSGVPTGPQLPDRGPTGRWQARGDAAASPDGGGLATTIEVEALPGRTTSAKALRRQLSEALTTAVEASAAATSDPGAEPRPAGQVDDARRHTPRQGDSLSLAAAASGVDLRGWRGPVRPDLDRTAPAIIGVRAVLRSFAGGLDANWQGAISHTDDEFLHDLRIAVRQTRSLLAQARRVLPSEVRREQREAFRWLGTITSPARDLDVYIAGWGELTSLLDPVDAATLEPVLAHLAGQRAEAHGEVARALGSPHAHQLRTTWRAWLDLPDDEVTGGKHAAQPLGVAMGARIQAAQQQVLDRGRRIDARSPATELHELRKDGKRLRYLLEGFGHLGGKKRSKATIAHLKQLQDNLGAFQDAEVQADRLRTALAELAEAAESHADASLPPGTLQAGERLATALDQRREDARTAFDTRFAAYDRKPARRNLRELVDRMSR